MKMERIILLAAMVASISACGGIAEVDESAPPENLLSLPFESTLESTFNPAGAEFFTLDNGVLSAVRGEETRYIASNSSYDDFLLTLEYWVEPSTNSGIYLRCENADSYSPQTCYEANIWDDHRIPENRTGSIVSFAAPLVTIDSGDRWNRMSILAEGDHMIVRINGVVTADITDDTHSSGYIAFQYGGADKMVRFRNLEIRPL